jgi:hypothetical protein
LPLGGGISKTARIGGIPVKLDAEMYYYVQSAYRLGTEWMFRFKLTPAFSNPLFD